MTGSCSGFHRRNRASASAALGRKVPQIIAPPTRSRAAKPLNVRPWLFGGLAVIALFAGQDDKAACNRNAFV